MYPGWAYGGGGGRHALVLRILVKWTGGEERKDRTKTLWQLELK